MAEEDDNNSNHTHQSEDDDIIIKKDEAVGGSTNSPEKKRLTPEEAAAKAAELQRKLREARIQREKAEAIEADKRRMESTKALLDAQRRQEEAEAQRYREQRNREKEEQRIEKERQHELLVAEWKERFGPDGTPPPLGKKKSVSCREQACVALQTIKQKVKAGEIETDVAIRCLTTCKKYMLNVKMNPTDPKFRKIRVGNAVFQREVRPVQEGMNLLTDAGFVMDKDGEFMAMETQPDGFLLGEIIKFLDVVLASLSEHK